MYYLRKRMEIAGCHRLRTAYPSKCNRLHGHNWRVTVFCRSRQLDENGMVADFTRVKELIHGRLDHGNLNELLPFNPTAENLARWVQEQVPHCYRVEVEESEGNMAAYETDDETDDKTDGDACQ